MNHDRSSELEQRLRELVPVQELMKNTSTEDIIQNLRLRLIEYELDIAELREENHRLKQVCEYVPLASAVFDSGMNYLYANPRWISDHDSPEPDLTGRNHYDLFSEISDEWKAIHQRCLAGEVNIAERAPFPRADGSIDWMRWDIRPWYDTGGTVGGLLMFTEYTTPIVQIEEEAQLYWNRYQQLFATAPLGMALLRSDTSVVQANSAFAAMLGYDLEQILASSLAELTAIDDGEYCQANMQAVFKDEIASFTLEKIFRRADDGFVWTNFTAIPVHDAGGNVAYLLAMFEDITERKAMLTRLQNSEARYRSVVEGQADLICRYGTDFRLTFVNEAYCQTMGRKASSLIGQNILEMISPSDVEQAHQRVLSISTQQPVVVSEHRTLLADGSIRWHQWKDTAIFDDDGTILEYQGVGRDITEHKQIEDALYFVAQRGWTRLDVNFLDALVNYISQTFRVSHVFIGQLTQPDARRVQTISFSEQGSLRKNIIYDLTGAPCENVIGHTLCCYPSGVQNLFPKDAGLARMQIEGYMGIPLWDSDDKPLGIIVVMDHKPLENIPVLEAALQIIAVRAAHELEQTLSEQALRESETKYRTVVDTLAEGVFMLDRQGQILAWNTRAAELLHVAEAQFPLVMTDTAAGLVYIDEDDCVIAPYDYPPAWSLRTGQARVDHVIGIRYPDQKRWFVFNTQPLFRENALMPYAVVCSFSDITAERLAQEQIINSEKRFRTLFENAPLMILQVDHTGKIHSANEMAAQLSGYTIEQLEHSSLSMLLPDWESSRLAAAPDTQLPEKFRHLNMLRIDGTYLPVELASNQVQYHDQTFDILFLNDISLRLHAQEERRKAERLSIELDKERELRELKTRFITMVSHEFRTPMAIIMTSTAYLNRIMEPSEAIGQRLDRIDEQIKRLARLIDDVTTLNKWDLIPVQVRREPLDVEGFFNQVTEEVLLIFDNRRPDLRMEFTGQTTIRMDETLLYQIYINLLTNALKYSHEGDAVQVRCDVTGEYLRLIVRDQGIGVPQEDRQHLFESFRRASNVEMISGTGLGLAIVARAVDALNGVIEFETELNTGTTFTINLPLAAKES